MSGGVPPGAASHQDEDRLLQVREAQRAVSECHVSLLGYCFRPRAAWGSRSGRLFCGYTPAVSPSALKAMREKIRDLNIRRRTQLSLDDIAERLNPLLQGWIQYYGRFAPSALHPVLRYVNQTLLAWA